MSDRYLVVNMFVSNRKDTGYRGVYRHTPLDQAFREKEQSKIEKLEAGLGDEEHPSPIDEEYFSSIEEAAKWAGIARSLGYDCELIRFAPALDSASSVVAARRGECFAGWDVAILKGAFYSVLVDDCIGLWDGTFKRGQWESVAAECMAEYFNTQLNEHRLFPDLESAQRFLFAYRETLECFGGDECALEASPLAIYLIDERK